MIFRRFPGEAIERRGWMQEYFVPAYQALRALRRVGTLSTESS
jgi:hypothetical protein